MSRVLLFALVGGATFFLVVAGVPTSCADELTATGDAVRVCSPLGLTDRPAVFFLLAVGLLLVPELPEISDAGGIGMKRDMDKVASDTVDLRESLREITNEVTTLSANLANAAAARATSCQDVNLWVGDRAQQAGTGMALLGAGPDGALQGTAADAAAFRAGFEGLSGFLVGVECELVGLTRTRTSRFEAVHYGTALREEQRERAVAYARNNRGGPEWDDDLDGRAWMFAAPARIAGQLVGMLVAVVPASEANVARLGELRPPPGKGGGSGEDEETTNDVETKVQDLYAVEIQWLADAYGSLLFHLLGEGTSNR